MRRDPLNYLLAVTIQLVARAYVGGALALLLPNPPLFWRIRVDLEHCFEMLDDPGALTVREWYLCRSHSLPVTEVEPSRLPDHWQRVQEHDVVDRPLGDALLQIERDSGGDLELADLDRRLALLAGRVLLRPAVF
jgi:hypothetical protein